MFIITYFVCLTMMFKIPSPVVQMSGCDAEIERQKKKKKTDHVT